MQVLFYKDSFGIISPTIVDMILNKETKPFRSFLSLAPSFSLSLSPLSSIYFNFLSVLPVSNFTIFIIIFVPHLSLLPLSLIYIYIYIYIYTYIYIYIIVLFFHVFFFFSSTHSLSNEH